MASEQDDRQPQGIVTKASLRRVFCARRQAVSAAEAVQAGERVVAKLARDHTTAWHDIHRAHVYRNQPHLGEVSTEPLVAWLASTQPHVPVTLGDASPNAAMPEGEFDVIFIPVVGFDRGGNRLGMGGGWYDRWLATQPHALKIGLAYTWAETPHLPHDPHDIPLDMLLVV
jgi:5-formyltetrahydrofolate cyclo-ligase